MTLVGRVLRNQLRQWVLAEEEVAVPALTVREAKKMFINDRIARGRVERTIDDYHRVLDLFVEWCEDNGYQIGNLTPNHIRSYNVTRLLSDAETLQLLEACRTSPYARRDAALWLVFLDTGLRLHKVTLLAPSLILSSGLGWILWDFEASGQRRPAPMSQNVLSRAQGKRNRG